jgi:two-component system, OmpR family, response regulator
LHPKVYYILFKRNTRLSTKCTTMKALIIDDEIDICYLLGGLLRNKNMNTNFANSIREAMMVLEELNPEIIFLDNHLPDGKGVDFIQYIKKHHPAAKLVMITAYDTAADRKNAFSKGVDYFVAKPFSSEKIYQTLEHFKN